MEIGIVTAFLGGVLALLSPCAALLLPAYYASTVGSGPRLYLHTGIFFLGLVTVLVPLGIGLGAIASVFSTYRSTIIIATSIILVLFGVMQIWGWGFDMSKYVPGYSTTRNAGQRASGYPKSFMFGLLSGVAGFCAGPILGAVLTLVVAHGNALGGALLLLCYAAGMVLPLMCIASVWNRNGPRGQSWLRGKQFTVFGRSFHTTSVITGCVLIAAGILFWSTNGLLTAQSLVSTDSQSKLQQASGIFANPAVDIAVIVIVMIALLTWWYRRQGKHSSKGQEEQ